MKKIVSLGLLFIMFAVFAFGCRVNAIVDDILVIESRDLEPFNRILIKGGVAPVLMKGEKPSLKIETTQRKYANLSVKVEDGCLIIDNGKNSLIVGVEDDFFVSITYTELTEIAINGGADISINRFNEPSLSVIVNGGSNLKIEDLQADSLKITINGAANIRLAGKVQDQELVIRGGASYNGMALEVQNLSLTITGAGNADVWVRQNLKLNLAGIYSVNYWGRPAVEQSLGGLGSLVAEGDK